MPAQALERMMKASEVMYRLEQKQIRVKEAAELLRVSERSVRRYRARCRSEGSFGLFDKRCIRPSAKRMPKEKTEQVLGLYRERYHEFNVAHFHEVLYERHGIRVSYTWLKTMLREKGLIAKARPRGQYRRRRERRALEGMLLHLDGSQHPWLGAEGPVWDLLVLMDDASSEVYAACFVPEENTVSCMAILKELIVEKGIFSALYTDRASHFVITQDARKGPDRTKKTQVERALNQLGIQLICAYSPQARGRSERLFGTWQKRLVPELRLAGITTMHEANRYLNNHFIPWHNRTLRVSPAQQGSAFLPLYRNDLERIFSVQHSRIVQKDHTVQFDNVRFQIPKQPMLPSLAKRKVTLYQHLDGLISIGLADTTLGCFHQDGRFLCQTKPSLEPPLR